LGGRDRSTGNEPAQRDMRVGCSRDRTARCWLRKAVARSSRVPHMAKLANSRCSRRAAPKFCQHSTRSGPDRVAYSPLAAERHDVSQTKWFRNDVGYVTARPRLFARRWNEHVLARSTKPRARLSRSSKSLRGASAGAPVSISSHRRPTGARPLLPMAREQRPAAGKSESLCGGDLTQSLASRFTIWALGMTTSACPFRTL